MSYVYREIFTVVIFFFSVYGRSATSECTQHAKDSTRRTNERHYELLVLENNFHELLTARKKRKTTMWAINLWRPFRHDNISL